MAELVEQEMHIDLMVNIMEREHLKSEMQKEEQYITI
jgi:hypothetical protein